MTPQVLYIFGKGKISILKFWYRFGDFLAFRSLSTPFLHQNGLENHFFKTITHYIFLERYCYVEFRYWGIFDNFGHLVPNFGRRSPFFDQNGLENNFFKNITNYIFLERYCYVEFRYWGILNIFGHLGSWRAVLHQNGLENQNRKNRKND